MLQGNKPVDGLCSTVGGIAFQARSGGSLQMSAEASHIQARAAEKAPANNDLTHIPGEDGLPWLGLAIPFIRDARGLSARLRETYGPVYRSRMFGQASVALTGADALEKVLLNRDKNFSSELGWDHTLGRLFTRGLMLMDFDEHRFHRRIMNAAFKREALEHYMDSMNAVVTQGIRPWADERDFRFYPAIKQLTLDNAAVAFLGLELGPEADRLNKAFVDTVAASLALVRVPVPGLAFWKGLKGRQLLSDFFSKMIPERRGTDGRDMFTRLCNATNDDGESFTDQDIIDHMIFLMMAAHDTLTSTLTTSAYALAAHPEWQERLRAEARSVGEGPVQYDDLDKLEQTDWLFSEAMRMWGPVPYIPRRALNEFEWMGHRIPANTQVAVSPDAAHRDPEIWTEPDKFDPERFSPERAEHKRHAFGYAPYGGGVHKCLGMHFAAILAKVFLHRFVLTYECSVPEGYEYRVQQVPIPKPKDGLRLSLEPV